MCLEHQSSDILLGCQVLSSIVFISIFKTMRYGSPRQLASLGSLTTLPIHKHLQEEDWHFRW